MRERPILFSGPMVRALLAGTKTQTRRIVKRNGKNGHVVFDHPVWQVKPTDAPKFAGHSHDFWRPEATVAYSSLPPCPYGQPGDRLWVRESFMDLRGTGVEHYDADGRRQRYAFAADSPPGSYSDEARKDYGLKWKPSIHMPRSACRLVLEVTGVRVERLNDISEEDAHAEGCPFTWDGNQYEPPPPEVDSWQGYGRASFSLLWSQINGPDSWQTNPWVWVVEFRVLGATDNKEQ